MVAVVVVIADTLMTGETVAVTPLEEIIVAHQIDRMLGGVATTLTVDGIDNSNNKMK